MDTRPFGSIEPNSQHQRWSQWTITIHALGRPTFSEVKLNAARYLRVLFGSVARAKVEERIRSWVISAQVEGVPAHDPHFVAAMRRQIHRDFVEKGWGALARSTVEVELLAGDRENGTPRDQLIVMPRASLN